MKNPFNIFALRNQPERWLALVSVLVFGALNALLVYAHWDRFTMARHGPTTSCTSLATIPTPT